MGMDQELEQISLLIGPLCGEGDADKRRSIERLVEGVRDQFREERLKRSTLESVVAAMEVNLRTLEDRNKELEAAKRAHVPASDAPRPVEQPTSDAMHAAPDVEADELRRLLDRKAADMQNLTVEIDRLSEKNKQLWQTSCRSDEELAEAKSRLVSCQIQISSLENELGRREGSLNEKASELAALNESFAGYRKEKAGYIVELEGKLEHLKEQADLLGSQLATSRSKQLDQERLAGESREKMQALQLKMLEQEEAFKSEVSSQVRLADLYKRASDEANGHLMEVEQRQASAEELLEKQAQEFKLKIEDLAAENEKLAEKVKSREKDLEQIQRYVESDFISAVSPTAGMVERMEKSGKSFGEIYAEYLKLQQDFLREKHEKENLKDCLDEVMRDIESNAPVLQRNQQELARTKNEMTTLLVENSALKDSCEKSAGELEQSLRSLRGKEREIKFKDQQIDDLSRQVQVLLAEIEGDAKRIGSDSLSEKLIDIKSISDLQAQNQRLLLVTRELSEQLEEAKAASEPASTYALQERLQEALREVESLREARKKQAEVVAQLARPPAEGAAAERARADDDAAGVHRLRSDYEAYKSSKDEICKELNSQINLLRKENSDLRIEAFKLSSKFEIAAEKHSALVERFDAIRLDNDRLSHKNESVGVSLLELQQRLQQAYDDLFQSKSDHNKAFSKLSLLQVELDVVRSNNTKLSQELVGAAAEKERLSSILQNLQILQSRCQGDDAELKQRSMAQLESAEKELFSLRSRVGHEMEYSRSLLHNFEREKSEYQARLNEANAAKGSLSKEVSVLKAKNEELLQRIDGLSVQLDSSEKRLSLMLMKSSDQSKGDSEAAESSRLMATVSRLHAELKLAKEHGEEFKALSLANENAAREANAFSKECLAKLEEFESQKQKEFEHISQQLSNAQQAIIRMEGEVSSLQESKLAIMKETEEAREMLAKHDILQKQLAEKDQLHAQKLAGLKDAMAEEHEKYERELVAHANDVQVLGKLKQELSAALKELSEFKSMAEASAFQHSTKEEEWTMQRENMQNAIGECEFKLREFSRQNELLLNQIDTLSRNVPGAAPADMDEVVKFLRREKEILTCKNDILVKESKRTCSQLAQLNEEVSSMRILYEQERAKREIDSKITREYNALLEKVDNINILKESNTTLRGECERYKAKSLELQQQLDLCISESSRLRDERRLFDAQTEALRQNAIALERDNSAWKARLEQVLSRTETVDSAKYNELQSECSGLRQELEENSTKCAEFAAQRDELQERYSLLEARSKKLAQLCQSLKAKISQPSEEGERIQQELRELTGKVAELEDAKARLEEKNKKISTFLQKTADLKAAFQERLGKELHERDEEHEKKLRDLRNEHELRVSLLNSQWQAKMKKEPAVVLSSPDQDASPGKEPKRAPEFEPEPEPEPKRAKSTDEASAGESEEELYEESLSASEVEEDDDGDDEEQLETMQDEEKLGKEGRDADMDATASMPDIFPAAGPKKEPEQRMIRTSILRTAPIETAAPISQPLRSTEKPRSRGKGLRGRARGTRRQ